MSRFYIDIKLIKSRIEYLGREERDDDYRRILKFLRDRGFTPTDGTLKRVDSLEMKATDDPTFTTTAEREVEIN